MKYNVLLLETIDEAAMRLLHQNEQVQILEGYNIGGSDKLVSQHDIHAIITRGKGLVPKDLMDACPNLKAIARCGVGLENIDVDAASERKIPVLNAPGSNSATIAEHTLSLMMMLVRDMYQSVAKVKQDNWRWRSQYSGDELGGKTLGILGMGNIGQRVARFAETIGMHVIYWDQYQPEVPYPQKDMKEVLAEADVISIHLPLTPQTEGLIGEEDLQLMKPHAYLINTARGQIIDQVALRKSLQNGKLAGFAADVLAKEPPTAHEPLLSMPNVLITPHSGSLTLTTFRNMCVLSVNNILAVLEGKEPKAGCIFNEKALV